MGCHRNGGGEATAWLRTATICRRIQDLASSSGPDRLPGCSQERLLGPLLGLQRLAQQVDQALASPLLVASQMRLKQRKPRTVEVPDRSYRPSRAGLREDVRFKGAFGEAMTVLVRPVKVRRLMPAKR